MNVSESVCNYVESLRTIQLHALVVTLSGKKEHTTTERRRRRRQKEEGDEEGENGQSEDESEDAEMSKESPTNSTVQSITVEDGVFTVCII